MKNLKTMIELRNEKLEELNKLTETAQLEKRAFTEEENTNFDALEAEIKSLDATIEKLERSAKIENVVIEEEEGKDESKQEELEVRAFADYIRENAGAVVEQRAKVDMGSNGAIIPVSIAQQIIEKVSDMCPIFEKAQKYSVKGTIKIPVWTDNAGDNIKVAFADEFTELTEHAGKFVSVDLGGFLAGALTIIGKSVASNSDIDVVSFVVNEMAKEIASFLEKVLLNGEASKNEGALATTNIVTAGSASAITADELIDLQMSVKTPYQANACWTMNPATFTAIRKLKDGQGNYLVQADFTEANAYRILGKPVYLSDNMPTIDTKKAVVLYGDYSGLAVNMRENIEIQVLQEKYATQHALGVVAWFEVDSKVADAQKLAVLKMA